MYEDFNADKAREIVNSVYDQELNIVLGEIKEQAEKGKSVLHVYRSLKLKTKDELRSRGFKVNDESSIAIQVGNLYCSIYWE